MKKKLLFVILFIAAFLYGCNDKEPGPSIEEGEPTYMSVSLNFPKSGQGTRVSSDPNATDDEVSIKSVHILIYNDQGMFLKLHPMNIASFSPVPGNEDRYESTEQIKTTTGPKFIYAGINLPTTIVAAIEYQPMMQLANEARTFSMNELTSLTAGLPMFSIAASREDFVSDPNDPANHISIDVKRLVAKITVEKSAAMSQAGVPGTLGPIEFTVNNFNTKMFLQQGDAPEYKDPNWISSTYTPTDYVDTPFTDYVAAHDMAVNPNPTVNDYNALYTSENTSEEKKKKEITRVTVRATFLVEEITVVDNSNPEGYAQEPRPGSINSPVTFYTVTPGIGEVTRYFYDKTVADKYALDKGGTVLTYSDGLCYWDIFLNKTGTNLWDVLRNDYYKCSITKIVAPGRYSPDLPDPDVTPDADIDITADINILFWTPVLADYILEP